jgi:hypothetical protein
MPVAMMASVARRMRGARLRGDTRGVMDRVRQEPGGGSEKSPATSPTPRVASRETMRPI